MEKVKKVSFKKDFVVALVVLLAMLFPGVVFSSVSTSKNPFSSEGDLIIVAESCEDFEEEECFTFKDFKGQTLAYLTKSLELTKTLILEAETDIAKCKEDIATIVKSYGSIETESVQNYLERRLILEKKSLMQKQQSLLLLEEMSVSYEELLRSLQSEVTESKHIPIWKKRILPTHVETLSLAVEQFNKSQDEEKSPTN